MKILIKLFFVLLLLPAFAIGKGQNENDSIRALTKSKSLIDSLWAKNVLAYTYLWPPQDFNETVKLIDKAYAIATRINNKSLAQGLLARKIYFYAYNNKGLEAFSICEEMIRLGRKDLNYSTLGAAHYYRGNIFLSFGLRDKAIE